MKNLVAAAAAALLTVSVSVPMPAFADSADAGTAAETGEPPLDVSKLPFTADSIKQVIAYHQPKIQSCYEDLLASRKKVVEGRLMTSFVITAEGLVKHPKVLKKGTSPALRIPKLENCVVAVLAGMEFPKPKKGREQPIEYPFNLKAIK